MEASPYLVEASKACKRQEPGPEGFPVEWSERFLFNNKARQFYIIAGRLFMVRFEVLLEISHHMNNVNGILPSYIKPRDL